MTTVSIVLKNGHSFYLEGQMQGDWKPCLLEMWQQKGGIWEICMSNGHTLLVDVEELAAIEVHRDERKTT